MKKHSLGLLVFTIGLAFILISSGLTPTTAATKQIKFWTFLSTEGTDPRSIALKHVVDSFNASHPDIKVKVESIHWGKIDSMAIQATAAGEGPDVLNVYSVQLPQHVAAHTVQPMTKYARTWIKKEGKDYLFDLKNVTFNGKVMALPWEMRAWLLWYRKDILEKEGLTVPKTINELLTTAGKIRKSSGNKITGWAVGLSNAQLGAEFMEKFEPFLWSAGGSLLDKKGKAAFNSPAGVKIMQFFHDAVNKYGVMGREALSMTADDVLSGIKAGTIAMACEGSMRVSAARGAVGTNLMTAPIPGFSPNKPIPALTAGQSLTIGANSKNPKAAWQFIKYYLNQNSQLAFAKAGVMPVIDSAYKSPQIVNSKAGAEMEVWKNYVHSYGRLGRYPDDFAKLSDIIVKAAQEIIYNNAPIKETLNRAANEYNAMHR
jgi:multiple sugar transport system substrate-binding protein